MEKHENLGDTGDYWQPGQTLGPGNGESVATASGTYPNTDSYVGGVIKVTGLVIDDFTETESGVWSFRVTNLAGSSSPCLQSFTFIFLSMALFSSFL